MIKLENYDPSNLYNHKMVRDTLESLRELVNTIEAVYSMRQLEAEQFNEYMKATANNQVVSKLDVF